MAAAAAAAPVAPATPATQISKKRKLVADGVFYAEINKFFEAELGEAGYSGLEVRVTPAKTEIILRATKTLAVVGEKNRRIQELTSMVQKRFNFPENSVQLFVFKVQNHGLSAVAQAESLRFKLLSGLPVRRACYGVLRFIMEAGAKGVEITISGKLRGARAKAMKFRDGYMVKSGNASNLFVDYGVRNILLKQGIVGIRVAIMMPNDQPVASESKAGTSTKPPRLSDFVHIKDPKADEGPAGAQPKAGFGVDARAAAATTTGTTGGAAATGTTTTGAPASTTTTGATTTGPTAASVAGASAPAAAQAPAQQPATVRSSAPAGPPHVQQR